jgi:hypothetical protein
MQPRLAFMVLALASPGLLAASAIEQLPASTYARAEALIPQHIHKLIHGTSVRPHLIGETYQICYIDGVRFAAVEALRPVEMTDPYKVGSETISDINASYRFDTGNFDWLLTLGVDNVFEAEPPPGSRTGRFTGGSPYYDPIGRFYYAGVKVGF